jgi:hypothetical protein
MKITNVGSFGGEPLHHPFPAEAVIDKFENAGGFLTEHWFSPPVLIGKKAQRLGASRTYQADGKISTHHWHEEGGSWTNFVSKENWAGSVYGSENDPHGRMHFRRQYDKNPAKALQKKWYSQMVDFLFAHDPEERLKHQDNYRRFMDYEKKKAKDKRLEGKAFEDRFGKITHGDVVLTHATYNFEYFDETRMFVMLRPRGTKSTRLKPHIWQSESKHTAACSIRRTTKRSFMKVGEEAFKEIPDLSQHDKIKYLQIARQVRELADIGYFD